jgi:RND superfamily putative drug exporter
MSLVNVRRFWVAGVVFATAVGLLPFSFHAERHLETATRVEGSEAETVRQELVSRFHSPFVDRVVLVIQGLPPADSVEGEQALGTIVTRLREEPGVSGVVSHYELRDPIFLGKGGGTFVLVGLSSTEGPVESLVPKLHERANSLANQLRGRYPTVKLELTGELPLNFDIRKASAEDVQRGESLVIPATLALLLVAFGSLVAALIPLAVGQLAIGQPLQRSDFGWARWISSLGHGGTSGRSYAPDFIFDGSHRISSALDGSHQRNPFHCRGGIPGGGNQCVAYKYPRSGGAGVARPAD